jgi:gamma-glutamyl hercynylcysteine S-oxide synthase
METGPFATLLGEARARTLLLISTVSEDDLRRQHDPLMGPILWDLGHIAHFEALWLLDNLRGEIRFGEMPGMYNPFEHPRATRGLLELPTLAATVEAMDGIRARVLDSLAHVDVHRSASPLLRDGYVYHMVLQHEYQHNETMLQTLQLKLGEPYRPPGRRPLPDAAGPHPEPGSMVRFPGGRVAIGTADRARAYDNERPLHAVELRPFLMDAVPVTNASYLAFMEDGGYRRPELWSEAGRSWLEENGATAPKYWTQDGLGWSYRVLDRTFDAADDAPVCHVCWYEAEAYARWAGRRLPTETEWEAAASWDPETGTARHWPWGEEEATAAHANVDQLAFRPARVGSHPRNVSPIGCHGMIGDVWEWTSSAFGPYPGFESFPYPEYSEAFFDGRSRVLRGGSWATRPGSLRNTFRNWDFPIRRQIFAGFRCALDD